MLDEYLFHNCVASVILNISNILFSIIDVCLCLCVLKKNSLLCVCFNFITIYLTNQATELSNKQQFRGDFYSVAASAAHMRGKL